MPTSVLHPNSTATALEGPRGETRIYYQAEDGSIHERRGQGPAASGNNFSITKRLIPPGIARANTPLAVTFWGDTKDGKFNEIRLYYITTSHHLRELESNDFSDKWSPGIFDQKKFRAAEGSMLLYATCLPGVVNPGSPRVGFQSAENPGVITEAGWDNGWSRTVLQ